MVVLFKNKASVDHDGLYPYERLSEHKISTEVYGELHDAIKKQCICVKMYLVEEDIWIINIPNSSKHECVAPMFVDAQVIANTAISGDTDEPIHAYGKTTHSSVGMTFDPDACFSHNDQLPEHVTVVLETAVSQTVKDTDRRVQNILTHFPLIKLVVTIATGGTHGIVLLAYQRGPPVVNRGDYGLGVPPTVAISFGDSLPHSTRDCILNTGVADASFTGMDRHGEVVGCTGLRMPMFLYSVPHAAWNIGAGVANPNMTIDLFKVKRRMNKPVGF
jgi:hypothetical protein